MMKLRTLVSLLCCCTCLAATAASAATRTVALSGQQAPGAPAGANFTTFFSPPTAAGPVINNSGRVAFAGQAAVGTTTYAGIWSDASGALTNVARSAQQAPGTAAGTNFFSFRNPGLNDAGAAAFDATVDSGAATNGGIWETTAGGLSLVGRKGSAAPGVGAGVNFSSLIVPSFSDGGQVAFRGQVSGTGVTVDNELGIWAEKAGVLTLIAREGSQAPGTSAGIVFDSFPAPPVAINAAGQVSFRGFLRGAGITAGVNRIGIWSDRSGSLQLVAREGDAVPGVVGASLSFIDDHSFNRNGQVAFVGAMTGVPQATNSAVFSEGSGSLAIVSRRGDAAPGAANTTFNTYTDAFLNGEGQTAFVATLAGFGATTATDAGIWSQRGGALSLVAREGFAAAGADAGQNYSTFVSPVLNSAGQIAFQGTLVGTGVTTSNDNGIWAQGLDGALRLVAREGGAIEVSPGVNRTISSLAFTGGVNTEDGRRSGFNDLGEVAFLATFTDGSSGLFVSDIAKPAPADFNGNGAFEGSDFLVWQRNLGRTGTGLPAFGDADADGNVNAADLATWRTKFGTTATPVVAAVPEPSAWLLALTAVAGFRFRRSSKS